MFGDVWTPNGTVATKRYVAALDVLGFKQRLQREGVARLFADYDHLRIEASRIAKVTMAGTLFGQVVASVVTVPFVVLSDTVLLWCDYTRNVDAFITSCCALVAESVRMKMPLRGGIALGDTIIDPGSLTFLGQPFVDAYLTEGAQEWVGAAVHPSGIQGLAGREDVVAYPVPVKTPAWKLRGRVPRWLHGFFPRRLLESSLTHALCWHHYLLAPEALELLGQLEASAGRKDRVKYQNTAEFVRSTPLPTD